MTGKLKTSAVPQRDGGKEKEEEKALAFELMWQKGRPHGQTGSHMVGSRTLEKE